MSSAKHARTTGKKRKSSQKAVDFEAALTKEEALKFSAAGYWFTERRLAFLFMTRSRAELSEAAKDASDAMGKFVRVMDDYIQYQEDLLQLTKAAQARVALVCMQAEKEAAA